MDIYDRYKPVRNAVSQLALAESLIVVWAYSQFLQIRDFKFPTGIEVERQFLLMKPPQKWVSEWFLEILAKEIIINSGSYATPGRSLRVWRVFASVINKLKDFEDAIPSPLPEGPSAFVLLNRVAHQQFIWQENRPGATVCARYYVIFNTHEINNICRDILGLSIPDLYLCGMGLIGHFLKQANAELPMPSEIEALSSEKIARFVEFCGQHASSLRTMLRSEQRYDTSFFYAYNSLRAYPLVIMSDTQAICPIPTLLFWKFTGGLYYELIGDPRFANAFGTAFQTYVGKAINRGINDPTRVLAEQSYGPRRRRKDTVDWILCDGNAAIFLECKVKRISWERKTALNDLAPLKQVIDFMAAAIIQVYKTIRDYEKGEYPKFQYDPNRKIYPVVVTLENWHIFGPIIQEILHSAVLDKLREAGIAASVIELMPFSIWHVADLERAVQILKDIDIRTFFDKKINDEEKRNWEWRNYMFTVFGKRIPKKELFLPEYNEIFSSVLDSSKQN